MDIQRKLIPSGKGNHPNKNLTAIKFITIHTTGNYDVTATAASHATYQYNGSAGASTSWHYTVDDIEIWQSLADTAMGWHAGDGNSGPGNTTSIGIEICVNNKDTFAQGVRNAAWLTAKLLKLYNLTIDKVVQHHHWTGKDCPANLRSGVWGPTWVTFLAEVQRWLNPVVTPTAPVSTVPQWHRDGFNNLVDAGVINTPSEWQDRLDKGITIGEVMAIVSNLYNKLK